MRAFSALLAGFITTTLLALAFTAAMKRFTPDWAGANERPAFGYKFVSIGSSFLAGAAGGYVTAWTAVGNPLLYVLVLGIIVLAFAALNALAMRGERLVRLQIAQVALAPLGVVAGGLTWLRVSGYL